jgi:alcohol dehydrogenase (cytochrome c)
MKRLALLVCGIASVLVVAIGAQTGVPPAKLLNPGTDSWPSYNGDYTGQRFSTLAKINDGNVQALSLGWMYRMNAAGGGNPGSIKGTPLQVNGVIYLTAPDHVWALDARTGREIWHFAWQSKGGIHIGNRGAAILNDWLFFETPDCNLV